jgi:hypothetical protein
MEDALLATILIVIEPEGLLAGIALGRRVGLVAADLLEVATGVAAEPDQDPAIALTEDARGRLPLPYMGGPCVGTHSQTSWRQLFGF